MEPPVEILIAILALSSPTDLPRIVCAGEARGKSGVRDISTRRDRDSFQRRWILIARIESGHVAECSRAFSLSRGRRAKVGMSCRFRPVCRHETRFIGAQSITTTWRSWKKLRSRVLQAAKRVDRRDISSGGRKVRSSQYYGRNIMWQNLEAQQNSEWISPATDAGDLSNLIGLLRKTAVLSVVVTCRKSNSPAH